MTQMIYEVYDALKSIDVSDEKATAVAKALGNQDEKLNAVKFELKEEIREFRSELKQLINGVKSDIKVVYWMLGVIVTMNIGLFWMVFRILQDLP
jgi:hypothetical protein